MRWVRQRCLRFYMLLVTAFPSAPPVRSTLISPSKHVWSCQVRARFAARKAACHSSGCNVFLSSAQRAPANARAGAAPLKGARESCLISAAGDKHCRAARCLSGNAWGGGWKDRRGVTGWTRGEEIQVRKEEVACTVPYDLLYCFIMSSVVTKRKKKENSWYSVAFSEMMHNWKCLVAV